MDMSCIAVSVIERGQKKLLLILKFLAMALMWYIAPVAAGYIAEQLLKEKRKRNSAGKQKARSWQTELQMLDIDLTA